MIFGDDDFEFAARIPPIHIGRQLPFYRGKSRRLTKQGLSLPPGFVDPPEASGCIAANLGNSSPVVHFCDFRLKTFG